MERFKERNRLYRWLAHQQNRVVPESGGSSDSNDNLGDDPNELTSVVCDGPERERDDPNEVTSVICDETKRESIIEVPLAWSENSIKGHDPNEVTSVICDETKRERVMKFSLASSDHTHTKGDDPNEVSSVICDETKRESIIEVPLAWSENSIKGHDPNEVTSVICDETKRERVMKFSLASSDHTHTKGDDPNEVSSVICDETKRESIIEVPLAWSENSIKGHDPNEVTSVICDETKRERVMKFSLASSDHTHTKGDDPNEVSSVICDETKRESIIEVPLAWSENSIKGHDPNEVTSVICDETKRERVMKFSLASSDHTHTKGDDPNEVSSVICDETKRESIIEVPLAWSENSIKGHDPNEVTSVICDETKRERVMKFSLASSDHTHTKGDDPNEVSSVICDETKRESIIEVPLAWSENSIKGHDPNEVTSVICDETKRERVMKFSLASSDHTHTKGDDPNEVSSVICDETKRESIIEVPLVSSENSIKGHDPNEVTSVICDETKRESIIEVPLVSSENSIKGHDPNEVTSVICDETKRESIIEVPLVSSENSIKGHDPNEVTSVICDETKRERVMKFSLASSDHTHTKGDDPDEVTSVICDETKRESTGPSQLTTVTSEDLSTAKSTSNELIPATSEEVNGATSLIQLREVYNKVTTKEINKIKKILYLIITSLAFRIFGVALVFVDLFFIVVEQLTTNRNSIPWEFHITSLCIAFFFFADIVIRVSVEGAEVYFSDFLNYFDAAIIVLSLVIDLVYLFYDLQFIYSVPKVTVILRPLRLIILIRIFHLIYQKRHLELLTRRIVSGNKRRYNQDGFDLDLTYITDRIIAMSFPSSGIQSFYRNPMKEVVRFLDTKHGNHYQVYNLCSEKGYDPNWFHHRVHHIKIDDHNVPTLSEMVKFSKEALQWLTEDDENVIVIHCKDGKGRTGTMVCACLIAQEVFLNAEDSLQYFGERRTDKTTSIKFQGVETPSQSRYVRYFADVKNLHNFTLPPRKILKIKTIIIHSIHDVGNGNRRNLKIQITLLHKIVFSCSVSKNCTMVHDVQANKVIINLLNCPPLCDDVKVKCFAPDLPKYYDNCPFFFWFNTSFIENNRLYLSRDELDNLHKPKSWKIYHPGFAVEIYFEDVEQ